MKKNPIQSKYCGIVNTVSRLLLIGSLLFVAVYWSSIPDQIPSHYDGYGNITTWSSKFFILIELLIYVLMYSFISFIERTPGFWNTGVQVTAKNKNFVHLVLRAMISTMKFIMVCFFTYMTVNAALAKALSPLFTPISLGLPAIAIIFFLTWLVIGNRRFK